MFKIVLKHVIYEQCIKVLFTAIRDNFIQKKVYDFKVGDVIRLRVKPGEITINLQQLHLYGTIEKLYLSNAIIGFFCGSTYFDVHRTLSEIKPVKRIEKGQTTNFVLSTGNLNYHSNATEIEKLSGSG